MQLIRVNTPPPLSLSLFLPPSISIELFCMAAGIVPGGRRLPLNNRVRAIHIMRAYYYVHAIRKGGGGGRGRMGGDVYRAICTMFTL